MNATEQKEASRGTSTDMSPEALSRRLDIVDELYEAWLMLKNAKKIEPQINPNEQEK
jgi:hypothetical protein